MKQYEAVIKVMEENGGYATLGHLYQNALKIEGCKWATKTPFASIRRIVQDQRYFFKIRPGLWALNSYKHKLPPEIFPPEKQPKEKQDENSHTYYQGLVVEIGNLKSFHTTVPSQDKNKTFLGKKLGEIAQMADMPPFGYEHIVHTARTVDVVWFNDRYMPNSFFEVEHSTDFRGALIKFVELQDYHANFRVIADDHRKKEFQAKISAAAFRPISHRVKFWSYDSLADYHSKIVALAAAEVNIPF